MIPIVCVWLSLSDQNKNVQTNVNFGWKMSDVQPLFQALYMWLTSTYIVFPFMQLRMYFLLPCLCL